MNAEDYTYKVTNEDLMDRINDITERLELLEELLRELLTNE